MQYSDLTTALGDLMVVQITNPASATPSNDTNFNNILPRIIDDAEQRIYRELDFLATRNIFPGTVLQNQKYLQIPPCAVVVQGVSIIETLPGLLGTSNVAGSETAPNFTPPFTTEPDSNIITLTTSNQANDDSPINMAVQIGD